MSAYAANLGRAARLLKRLSDIPGQDEFEGVDVKELVGDVLEAQNRAFREEAMYRLGLEVALPDNVIHLDNYSRRVPCA